jgi:hypothetical protein
MKTHLASGLIVSALAVLLVSQPSAQGQVYSWSTIAGTNSWGSADGTNSDARFHFPKGLAVDSSGNIYVSDNANYSIRKVAHVGTNWVVTTLAGSSLQYGTQDGTNSNALFESPVGITVDSAGIVYVADRLGPTIRKVAPVGTNWVVTTIAGWPGAFGSSDGTNKHALFSGPNGIGVDSSGNLFVADQENNTVRRILRVGTNWVTRTIAGSGAIGSADGTNRSASFSAPSGTAPDSVGNVYVTDQVNFTIRKLAPDGTNWVVSTIAGLASATGQADGTNSDARFNYPGGVAVDGGGSIYVADYSNQEIRKISPAGTNWVVSTIGGRYNGGLLFANGIGSDARFNGPNGVALDSRGNVYVADQYNGAIRRGIPLPVAQPVTVIDTTLTLAWSAVVGQLLQVQYTTDLGQNNWSNWGDQFVCANSTVSVPDSAASDAQRLYRLVVTP